MGEELSQAKKLYLDKIENGVSISDLRNSYELGTIHNKGTNIQ